MKILLTGVITILLCASAYGQELASKAGIVVSYEAAKTETAKKFDKWNVKVTINNTTGADLYFAGNVGGSLSLDASYLRIDIPNAKGLLTLNLKLFRAKMVDGVLSHDKRPVFKIPAGVYEETLETAVAFGDVPVVKGNFMIDPKSYAEVTGQASATTTLTTTTTPAATPAPAASSTEITVLDRASVGSGKKLLLNHAIQMPAARENRLTLDGTGNLVLSNDGGKTAVWSSETSGKQVSYGEMQEDGNFVLKTASGEEVWSTNTGGNPGAMIMLGSDGSVAIYTKEFASIWQAP